MAEQLGKIEKPEAEQFTSKRKLYLVPLLFSAEEAPAEYKEKVDLYWEQVEHHLGNLEGKIGRVNHVYCESITLAGDEGLKVMEKLSPRGGQAARGKCQNGAVLEATEDKELADENLDWERFLIIGFVSRKVAKKVSEFYLDASRKRYEHIARRIDETLKANEVGVLFIREGHGVQFPQDIEVFSVAPPALDEIHRWQRNRLARDEKGEPPEEPPESK